MNAVRAWNGLPRALSQVIRLSVFSSTTYFFWSSIIHSDHGPGIAWSFSGAERATPNWTRSDKVSQSSLYHNIELAQRWNGCTGRRAQMLRSYKLALRLSTHGRYHVVAHPWCLNTPQLEFVSDRTSSSLNRGVAFPASFDRILWTRTVLSYEARWTGFSRQWNIGSTCIFACHLYISAIHCLHHLVRQQRLKVGYNSSVIRKLMRSLTHTSVPTYQKEGLYQADHFRLRPYNVTLISRIKVDSSEMNEV